MKKNKINITVAILFLLLGGLSIRAQDKFCYQHLSPQIFADSVSSTRGELIDVRVWESRYNKVIKGARHISEKNDLKLYLDSMDLKTPLYFYCDKGQRSQMAAKEACMMGFINVYDLKGGMSAWKKEKLPVIKVKDND